MVSGRARVQQETDPRKCIVTYEGKPKWSPIWENNPRIARPYDKGDFQKLVARGANNQRPYHLAKTPEKWVYNLNFRPDVGELYFSRDELEFGKRHRGLIILEPHIKSGASPNKQWGWDRWQKLTDQILAEGLHVSQIGPHGTRLLRGARLIQTADFRHGCAVLQYARAAVLPEGGLHHAAAAVGLPAVVIFGGFTPIELTGYDLHRNHGASLNQACGMRIPCKHCAVWMAGISPNFIFDDLMELLND